MAKGQKPVILNDVNLGAEDEESFDFAGHFDRTEDPSYIPGYSEQVQANDIAATDDHIWYQQHLASGEDGRPQDGQTKEDVYKQIGRHPAPLPVEFMWLRTQDAAGLHSAQIAKDLMEYDRRRYRVAVWPNDFEPHGYGFPPAGHKEADGTIRRDDVTLYVVDGRAARAFKKAQQDYTQQLENPKGSGGNEVFENKRETVTVTT